MIQQLDAVNPAHERFGIVFLVPRLVGAPDMRDLAELLRPARNLPFEESVLLQIIAGPFDEAVDVQDN